jgi:TolA-binding protein
MKKAGVTELGRARVYFGRAELARMTRKPKEAAELMDRIAKEIAPKDLGATLLALSGDRMLERNEIAKATAFYKELMNAFPKSEQLDYAYNGLGQIALIEKRYADALKWFTDAVDKIGATTTLKDVTLGKGRALLELGKSDEAKVIFEQVGATKEWKGAVTAESMYYLGELAFRKNDYTTATQLFQRVTVAYQRYPGVVIRCYLRAADAFEKLGEPAKAKAVLEELVSKEKFASLPEVEVARKRLEAAQ